MAAPDFPRRPLADKFLYRGLVRVNAYKCAKFQVPSSWMTANLLTLNSSKTEFLLIGLKQQLSKIQDCSLTTTHSARNLGFIFDEHLTFSDQITALSKSCYYHIRELRCIRPYLDFKTASTIATSIVHSKLHPCNFFYHNLPNCQLKLKLYPPCYISNPGCIGDPTCI